MAKKTAKQSSKSSTKTALVKINFTPFIKPAREAIRQADSETGKLACTLAKANALILNKDKAHLAEQRDLLRKQILAVFSKAVRRSKSVTMSNIFRALKRSALARANWTRGHYTPSVDTIITRLAARGRKNKTVSLMSALNGFFRRFGVTRKNIPDVQDLIASISASAKAQNLLKTKTLQGRELKSGAIKARLA